MEGIKTSKTGINNMVNNITTMGMAMRVLILTIKETRITTNTTTTAIIAVMMGETTCGDYMDPKKKSKMDRIGFNSHRRPSVLYIAISLWYRLGG